MAGSWKAAALIMAFLGAAACGSFSLSDEHPPERMARVDDLNARAEKAVTTDPKVSLDLAEKALLLARSSRYPSGEALALYNLGEAHRTLESYSKALENFEAARRLFESLDNPGETARAIRRLGDVQFHLARHDRAIALYLDALRMEESLAVEGPGPHALRRAHLLTTLGNVFRATGDLDQALDYYQRALEAYEKLGYTLGVAGAHGNLASVLQDRRRLKEALDHNLLALSLARTLGDRYLISIVLANAASVYLDLEEPDRAEPYLRESRAICERDGRKRGIVSALLLEGKMREKKGPLPAVLPLLERARSLAQALGDPQLESEIQRSLSSLYARLGDFRRAYEAEQRYTELRNQVLDAVKAAQINQLRVAYEAEKKEQEIEALKRDRKMQDRIRWTLLGIIFLAMAVLGLLAYLLRQRARHEREIEAKGKELREAYARVEMLSRTDDLTGLLNRRAVWERIQQEICRSERSGGSFALVLADLDDFKQVNDIFGHAAGDALLTAVARRIPSVLREQDTVARWGGEEFLLLLPETDREGALLAAEKVRQSVEKERVPFGDRHLHATLTLGVGVFDPSVGLEAALRQADVALYAGKAAGKNRVG